MKAIIDYTIDVSSEYEGVDCVVPHENYIHIHGFAYGRVYSLDIQKRNIIGVRLYYDGMRDTFEGDRNE